jgi:formyltetrahydrofolate-dependent phosphoribosylglycinamide formyltransferase
MQSIIDSTKNGILERIAEVVLVISNNPNAYALELAKNKNVRAICVNRKRFEDEDYFNDVILKELQNVNTDIVCLAGYVKMLGQNIVNTYSGKILNIHPALLPKFSGKGMYGHYVHEAVVKAREIRSGATVHFVKHEYDTGKIIIQHEIDVFESDTPNDVAKRVLAVEHQIYSEAIKKVIENEVKE